MAFCKFCGSSIPDQAEFCPECGKKAPTAICTSSPLTAQDPTSREPFSRQEFFSAAGSADAKKRIRANWIALAMAVILRVVMIPVSAVLMMPGGMRGQYMGYAFSGLIFSATGLCILMLLFACAMKHWGFAAAAVVLGVYKLLAINSLPLIIGHGALIIASVIVLINMLKLQKEYRAYLDHAGFDTAKK